MKNLLQKNEGCGIIASSKGQQARNPQIVAGSSFRCRCSKEILRTNPNTRAQNFPAYCRFCHKITVLDIIAPEPNLIPDRSLRA